MPDTLALLLGSAGHPALGLSGERGDWVMPMTSPGVVASNAPEGEGAPPQKTMALKGDHGVLRTGREIPAGARQEPRDGDLVESNQAL